MIAQLVFGLLLACSLLGQTRVELTKQVKGALPPDKGGTGVSSCLENEGLVWQSGEFACSALASGPHAPTHQHGGTDEVATAIPADDAIPKAGGGGKLAEGWIPTSISRDNESPAPGDISGSLAAGYVIAPNAVRSAELDQSDNYTLTGAVNTKVLNQVQYTEQFDWIQDPGTAISVGLNTVTLSPCPSGVDGSWPNHYIWINDNTNALDEAVLITGGTCTSGAPSGTISFSAANAHTAGAYILESASDGVQECINALPRATLKPNGGVCVMPARELLWEQTVSIGNGTTSAKSDLFAVRLLGQGTGEVNAAAEATTQLNWVGPANGTMLHVRGFIIGVELGHFRIHAQSSADINLHLTSFNWSWIHDLVVLNTGANGIAIKLDSFDSATSGANSQNRFDGIAIITTTPGTTGIEIGNNDFLTGGINSRNVFRSIDVLFSGDSSTSNGIFIKNADNNVFLNVLVNTPAGGTGGCPIKFEQMPSRLGFPSQNAFYMVHPSDRDFTAALCGTVGTGGAFFWPWPGNDPGPVTLPNVYSLDFQGNFTGNLNIDGTEDAIQLSVKGHSTQTNDMFLVEEADGTDRFRVTGSGKVWMKETLDFAGIAKTNLPTSGNNIGYCLDCQADATCTGGGAGAWVRCVGASCECDW